MLYIVSTTQSFYESKSVSVWWGRGVDVCESSTLAVVRCFVSC